MANYNLKDYEEFDFVKDFQIPLQEKRDLYNSKEFQILRENGIDPFELIGEPKVEGVGNVTTLKPNELEKEKVSFSQATLDFIKDLPENAGVSILEGLANFANNIVQVGGTLSNMYLPEQTSEMTTQFAQKVNQGTERFIADLNSYEQENDLNTVSKFLTDVGVDMAATVPAYQMLKKVGVPKQIALPLSFGLAYGFTGGDKDAEKNLFIDSEVINRVNDLLNVLPNTPEAEVAELVANTFEGTAWGAIGDRLIQVFKFVKNKVPSYMQEKIKLGAMGTAATGVSTFNADLATEEQKKNQVEQNPLLEQPQEKKTLDQSQIIQDDRLQLASAGTGPVFRSILKEAAQKIMNKGTATQMLGQIKNIKGVKASELKWSGLDEFLTKRGNSQVTKEEIKNYLQQNSLDVAEIQKPRNLTKAEGELELKLESDINEIERSISRMQKENPDALVLQDLDTYIYKSRTLGSNLEEETEKTGIGKMRILLEGLSEDDLLKRFNYKGKIVVNNIQIKDQPFTRTGPLPVNEADKLLASNDYYRTSRYEFEPLEIKKYFKNLELRKFNNTFEQTKPKFSDKRFTEAGGTDYKEIVFKLKGDGKYPVEGLQPPQSSVIIDKNYKLEPKRAKTSINYKSPEVHFGTTNEFAHVRFKTRDYKGQKVLAVEELQSDLAQQVSRGDVTTMIGNKIVDFPFKNNWYELVTKRLIRYAADNGFDEVAIPKANVIAKRYGQQIRNISNVKISVQRYGKGNSYLDPKSQMTLTDFDKDTFIFNVDLLDKNLNGVKSLKLTNDEIIPILKEYKINERITERVNDILSGKMDISDKFLKDKINKDLGSFSFSTSAIPKRAEGSGRGKSELYDQAIPSFLKKYAKKWNASVYDDTLPTAYGEGMPVTIIRLTPEMKRSVQEEGQALFNIFGLAGSGAIGAKTVSDSMKNNIISETTNK